MDSDLANVSPEGSGAVMVLTVDVIGDSPADGDEARAGRNGKEPSFREEYVEDVREADAALASDHASRFVETENAVEAAAVDQCAPVVETRVAVTAAEAVGEQGAGRGSFKNFRHLVVPCRFMDTMMRSLRVAAPRENSFDGRRSCGLLTQGCG